MKSVLFHCKQFNTIITGLSTRPHGVLPENILEKTQSMQDCIVAFVTIERGDTPPKAAQLAKEILQFCADTKHNAVFLCPFAHLSNNLAKSEEALLVLKEIASNLEVMNASLRVGHFGSDKELLIHLYGHPGNARYREF